MINEEVMPMKHIHDKLVRDRIPKIIENDHKTCATRILNDDEYLACLKSKLLEECHEVIEAEGEDIKKESRCIRSVRGIRKYTSYRSSRNNVYQRKKSTQ